MQKQNKNILKVGISTFLMFAFFFAIGSVDFPLSFELKKASTGHFFGPSPEEIEQSKKTLQKIKKEKELSDSLIILSKKEAIANSKRLYPKTYLDTSDHRERVLLIGDSQLEGLKYPLNEYCIKNNHKLVSAIIWYGSSTKTWALSDTLQYFLDEYKPTVVLFAIGLNELFAKDLDRRAAYMNSIINRFEENKVKYFWVGPAAWTKDNGIISVMEREVGRHFFPSHTITMDRGADGRHPSRDAAKLWFDKIAIEMTEKGCLDLSQKVDTIKKLRIARVITIPVPKN